MAGVTKLEEGEVFAEHYIVEKALSAGGMGAVYVVTDLNTDRRRALKVMLPAIAHSPDAQRRFSREARVGASIRSEHIVEVLDAGVDAETSTPFLVMELLEGQDLAEVMAERGPLAPEEVGSIFAPLCHALQAAHDARIVHRDLKPENLFMAQSLRSDATVTLKILDFGIAKIVAEHQTGDATQSMGTPLWMAPEQASREGNITPATDIWALGLIAFYLLTGRSYWLAAQGRESAPLELLREVGIDPLVPARQRAEALGRAERLPAGFDDWFGRAVARDPGARFDSVEELQIALDEVLSAAPALGDGPTLPLDDAWLEASERQATDGASAQLAPTSEGHPRASTTAATEVPVPVVGGARPWRLGVAVLVVVGVVVAFLVRRPASHPTMAAPAPTASPPAPSEPTLPQVGLAALKLHDAPPGKNRADMLASSFWLSAARDFAVAEKQVGAPLRWTSGRHFCEGQAALVSGDLQGAITAHEAAIAHEPEWAPPHAALAVARSRSGAFEAAMQAALEAQRLSPSSWRVRSALANIYARQGRLADALAERRRALQMVHGDNPILIAEVALGCHALRLEQEASTLSEQALGLDPELVVPRLILAERALEQGDGETALSQATQAVSREPRNADAHLARADALLLLKRDAEAQLAFDQALALGKEMRVHNLQTGRWKEVEDALSDGKLPAPREQVGDGARGKARRPGHRPHRSACAPGDPLCSDI